MPSTIIRRSFGGRPVEATGGNTISNTAQPSSDNPCRAITRSLQTSPQRPCRKVTNGLADFRFLDTA